MHHKMVGFIPTCSCYQKKQPRTEKHTIPPSVNIRLLRLPSIGIPRHGLLMAGASETFLAAEERRRFLTGGQNSRFPRIVSSLKDLEW